MYFRYALSGFNVPRDFIDKRGGFKDRSFAQLVAITTCTDSDVILSRGNFPRFYNISNKRLLNFLSIANVRRTKGRHEQSKHISLFLSWNIRLISKLKTSARLMHKGFCFWIFHYWIFLIRKRSLNYFKQHSLRRIIWICSLKAQDMSRNWRDLNVLFAWK